MDGILGVGPLEIMIIVVLALIFLGPERLPETIREIAKFVRQMRAIGNEMTSQFSQELNMLDEFNPKKILDEVGGFSQDDLKLDADLGLDKADLSLDPKRKTKKPVANTKAVNRVKSGGDSSEKAASTPSNAEKKAANQLQSKADSEETESRIGSQSDEGREENSAGPEHPTNAAQDRPNEPAEPRLEVAEPEVDSDGPASEQKKLPSVETSDADQVSTVVVDKQQEAKDKA